MKLTKIVDNVYITCEIKIKTKFYSTICCGKQKIAKINSHPTPRLSTLF